MKNLITLVCMPVIPNAIRYSFIPQRNEKSNNQFLSICTSYIQISCSMHSQNGVYRKILGNITFQRYFAC